MDKNASAPLEQDPGSGGKGGGGGGPAITRQDLEEQYGDLANKAQGGGGGGGQSSSPLNVRAGSGELKFSTKDLASGGFGSGWGQSRSYANIEGEDAGGANGNRWVDDQLWSLDFQGAAAGNNAPARIKVRRGSAGSLWFQTTSTTGVYAPLTTFYGDLRRDATAKTFIYTDANGNSREFFDNSTSHSVDLRGKMKGMKDPFGNAAEMAYDENDELKTVAWSGAGGTESRVYRYDYHDTLAHIGRLKAVTVEVGGKAVERSNYEYWTAGSAGGSENDLKGVRVENFDGAVGSWKTTKQEHYRYWKSGQAGGFQHGLKSVIGSETFEKMAKSGVNPATASDAQVQEWSDQYLEYNSDRKVSVQKIRGKSETYQYNYLSNSSNPGLADKNTWATKSEVILPNGNKKRYYTNKAGGTVLTAFEDVANNRKTYRSISRNADGRMTQKATSAAISSVSEPSTGSGSLTVNLNSGSGLIYNYEYASSTNPATGAVKGYPTNKLIKQGSSGTPQKASKITWATQPRGDVAIHKPAAKLTYTDSQDDADASTYQYVYTYYQDALGNPTFQVKQKITTLPVIPTGQNGTGLPYTITELFDEYGRRTWRKDERGYISRWQYVLETGALLRSVADVDTTVEADVPAGWTTPAGGGLNLVSDYTSDGKGRIVMALGPSREAVLKESDTAPTVLRTASFTLYQDAVHETWRASGYATGEAPNYGYETVGAVSLEKRDASGRVLDRIGAKRGCGCGPLQPTETFPQERWTSWTKSFYDDWGRETKRRVYHEIPASGEGFKDLNYAETRMGYDEVGRLIRKKSPGGTIVRSVFNGEGRLASIWNGTDDAGASESDPTGGGATGNNMVKILSYVYDNGTAGGNGLLTRRTEHVDGNSANDRVSDYEYDYRGWLVLTTVNDGTTSYLSKNTYDNAGRITRVESYHTSVSSGNLTGRLDLHHDNQNRVYKTQVYSVDPATGAVGNALVGESWFDGGGNLVKSTGAGSEAFVKNHYDSLDRLVASYLAWNAGTSSDDGNVTNDTVVEQSERVYDPDGNVLLGVNRQRFDDATGPGALKGPDGSEPRARVSYSAAWYDGVNRVVAVADYGTNGGAELERPPVVPERGDLVLVSSNCYDAEGAQVGAIDPMGVETHWKNDRAGRRVRLIENVDPRSGSDRHDANRTSEYRYTSDGLLEYLILVNAVTGNQVTQWVYGTTLAESGVARADLVRAKVYPEADDESDPVLADGDDGVYERIEYTYNRASQVVSMKDPNGTVHAYDYDELGRLKHDRVTTFAAHIDDDIKRISLTYNHRGLLATVGSYTSATVGSGTLANEVGRVYDGFGQMTKDRQSHSGAVVPGTTPEVGYAYANGSSGNTARRTSMTYPDGRVLEYGYGTSGTADNLLSRVASLKITGESGNLAQYTFVGAARYVKIAYPEPGVQLSYIKTSGQPLGDAGDPYTGYDRFGRTVDMRWVMTAGGAVRDRFQWGYDRSSNRTWRANLAATDGGQDEAYGYDGLYQVTSFGLGTLNLNRTGIGAIPAEEEGFRYDPTGNWLGYKRSEDGAIVLDQTRANNQDNQLVQIDGNSDLLEYDKAGNALKVPPGADGDWDDYLQPVWDAWNRLVVVKNEAGTSLASYVYDGLTRRITKTVGGTETHCYYSSQWKPLEEREGSETDPIRQYVWGARPGHRDELILRDRDTNGDGSLDERLYATMDYYNSTAVLDTSGNVLERYAYSAFGVRRIMAPDFTPRSASSFDWDFAYKGQFRDAETGYYNYGYRYYVPELGRWINRDPITERGGANLYRFVRNRLPNMNDKFGLITDQEKCDSINRSIDSLKNQRDRLQNELNQGQPAMMIVDQVMNQMDQRVEMLANLEQLSAAGAEYTGTAMAMDAGAGGLAVGSMLLATGPIGWTVAGIGAVAAGMSMGAGYSGRQNSQNLNNLHKMDLEEAIENQEFQRETQDEMRSIMNAKRNAIDGINEAIKNLEEQKRKCC